MSAYWPGKLLFDGRRNPRLMEEWQADPEAIMERYHFTEEEKAAVGRKDFRFFYELGINPYLVGRFAQFLGLEQGQTRAAIQDAKPHPDLPTVSFPGPPRDGQYLVKDAEVIERVLQRR